MTFGPRRAGAMAARNSRHRSAAMGSAPLKITRTRDRSSDATRSRVVRSQVVHVAEVRRARHAHPVLATPSRATGRGVARTATVGMSQWSTSREQGRQVKADQAHVVRQRHPRQARVVVAHAHALGDRVDVGREVAVREDHALGLAGRARRELDERDVVAARRDARCRDSRRPRCRRGTRCASRGARASARPLSAA